MVVVKVYAPILGHALQVHSTQGIFPSSGFTYPNTGSQEKQSSKPRYQLANLGFSDLCVSTFARMGGAENIWPVLLINGNSGFTKEEWTIILEKSKEVTHIIQNKSNTIDKSVLPLF